MQLPLKPHKSKCSVDFTAMPKTAWSIFAFFRFSNVSWIQMDAANDGGVYEDFETIGKNRRLCPR
jgi:hypothetical protein